MPVTVSRRNFVRTAAGAAACGLARAAAGAAQNSRLELSAPLTHSDWMLKPGMKPGAEGVKHMLDACKACGWKHVYWRVFDAGQSTYNSKLMLPASRAEPDNFHNPQAEADRQLVQRFFPGMTDEHRRRTLERLEAVDYSTFDSLAAAIAYGHSIGLEIHAWATINEDDHGWGWRSEFAKANPEYRWVRRDGRPYRSQLSFAFPEVRRYKLGLIEELLSYNIDGLFIDWIRTGDVRDNPQTDAHGVADSGYEAPNVETFRAEYGRTPQDVPNDDERWLRVRVLPQTVFMRGLRELVGQRLPIAVMVGHPWHYRGLMDPIAGNLHGLLLDVTAWAEEGLIDAAVAAGYYRPGGSPEAAFAALKEETRGRVDLWHYAWTPQTPEECEREFATATRLGASRLLFWEADYIDDRPNAAALKRAMAARAAP